MVNWFYYFIAPVLTILLLFKSNQNVTPNTFFTRIGLSFIFCLIYWSLAFSYNNRVRNTGYIVKLNRGIGALIQFMLGGILGGFMLCLFSWLAINLVSIQANENVSAVILIMNSVLYSTVFIMEYFLLPEDDGEDNAL